MKILSAFFVILTLAACASPEPPIRPIAMNFEDLPSINLNTRDLQIIDRSRFTPQNLPYISHMFTPTVNATLHKIVNTRLHARGQAGHAAFIIKEAYIRQDPLPIEDKLFTREQAIKYTGHIEVELEAQSPAYVGMAKTTVLAEHHVTLPEDPTEYEKHEAYRKLLSALMTHLNQNLDQGIKEHMSNFLFDPSPQAPLVLPAIAPTTDSTLSYE
ncbi:MAG: hypothetical protein AB7S81_06715 [Bdellovibrionales bacterium]